MLCGITHAITFTVVSTPKPFGAGTPRKRDLQFMEYSVNKPHSGTRESFRSSLPGVDQTEPAFP